MAIDEKDVRRTEGEPLKTGLGLLKGLGVTLKHMLQPSVTQQYPEERPNLPARTRGVIALKQENCTVCYKCSRECPDWCIYIDAHKETHEPASGGRGRSMKVLDRFAIDYALCMYCGICVEVCPFDALFWSPAFEYSEYSIVELTHEKERLQDWTYHVLPPPALEEGAEPPPEATASSPEAVGTGPLAAAAAASPPPVEPAPPAQAQPPEETLPAPATAKPERAAPAVAEAGETSAKPAPAGPRGERVEVQPDQETLDRVLAELLAKGTDRRVAEGQARRAAMIAARKKAQEG